MTGRHLTRLFLLGTIFSVAGLQGALAQPDVDVTIGTLPPGKVVCVTFQATIDSQPPGDQVSTQGTVSGTNFSNVLTNDPDTPAALDPTVTLVPPALGSIGDLVWLDQDGDGIQDAGEPGINGVIVNLIDATGTFVEDTTATDPAGNYTFLNVPTGNHIVEFVLPTPDHHFTRQDIGGDDTRDSDADLVTGRVTVTVSVGVNDADVDCGLGLGVITVNDNGDFDDGNLLNPTTTLREAVNHSNGFRTAQTINFVAGLSGSTVLLSLGQLTITDDVTINGLGKNDLTISGGGATRVFEIASGVTASLNDLTIADGVDVDRGGGVYNNNGTLLMTDCCVRNCSTTLNAGLPGGAGGGGLFSSGGSALFSIERCEFRGNRSAWEGGAIHVRDGSVISTLTDSLIFDNECEGFGGGGIRIRGGSGLRIVGCTLDSNRNSAVPSLGGGIYSDIAVFEIFDSVVSNNTAINAGGGIVANNGMIMVNTTVSGNAAPNVGAGILCNGGPSSILHSTIANNIGQGLRVDSGATADLSHSIVAENSAAQTSVDAGTSSLTSSDYNLIGDGGAFTSLPGANDLFNTNPLLGPLQNNGGTTETHPLLAGSPARNAGDPAFAPPPDFDQRGPGSPRVVGTVIDIGAFEALGAISNFVFHDLNANGIQDPGEPGLPGLPVQLRVGATVVDTTTTDANGEYWFLDVQPGTYGVQFIAPAGFLFTFADQGGDDTVDSDASESTGRAEPITLAAGEDNTTVDCGMRDPCAPDLDDPIAICQNVTVQLNALGTGSITAAQVDFGSNDACGGVSLSVSPDTFTCANVGLNTVTLTVTDTTGNTATCTATVTVQDNVPPTAICQSATVQLNAAGNGSITPADVDGGSNDACGLASLSVAPSSFNCSNVGANTVTLTATDVNGNTDTCTATVTVQDNVPPNALCRNVTVQLDANGNASITAADINNGSNDACGLASLSVAPSSFTCSNVGANTVTLTVTDNNGNSSTCTATVTVQDSSISDFVFADLNANGIQDGGEPGIDGVRVNLLDATGAQIATTLTAGGGLYLFDCLAPGTPYNVEFVPPVGLAVTLMNKGGDDTLDSDARPSNGVAGPITLGINEHNTTVDCGLYDPTVSCVTMDVLLVHTVFQYSPNDVRDKLASTGRFGVIDIFDARTGTPSLAQLSGYDAALVFSQDAYADRVALGNVMAQYFDGGGGAATAVFEVGDNGISATMAGQWAAGGSVAPYRAIPRGTGSNSGGAPQGLGTVHVPAHPIMSGVSSFNGGDVPARPNTLAVLPTATRVADWTGGQPLIATTVPNGDVHTVVDLGFIPASRDSLSVLWVPHTDGAAIMANSLQFSALNRVCAAPASISDFVWQDTNGDGIQQVGEPGVPGVTVDLLDSGLNVIASDVTDPNGLYSFTGLFPTNYYIELDPATVPPNLLVTFKDQGGDDTLDSDIYPANLRSDVILLASGENNDTIDAGFIPQATVGNIVFHDLNGSGVLDVGEPGIPGVLVEIVQAGSVVGSDTSDANGLWSITGLLPGTYSLQFSNLPLLVNPPPFEWTFQNLANPLGSDVIEQLTTTEPGTTPPFTLAAGVTENDHDAGAFRRASVGDVVWFDYNRDGIQQLLPGGPEPGLAGIQVQLSHPNPLILPAPVTTFTGPAGGYQFANLIPVPGYRLRYLLPLPGAPQISQFSPPNAGPDPIDSDVTAFLPAPFPGVGSTDLFALTSGEIRTNVDAGMMDITNPTITDIDCPVFPNPSPLCTPDPVQTIPLFFDEPVFLNDPGQIQIELVSLNLVSVQPVNVALPGPDTEWLVTVQAIAEGPVSFGVGPGAFRDLGTNPNNPLSPNQRCDWIYDATPPDEECGGELAAVGGTTTSNANLFASVLFTEPVYGVDPSDFSVTGGATVLNVTPNAGPAAGYTVHVLAPGTGVYTLTYNPSPDWIEDCAGNDFPGSNSFVTWTVITLAGTTQVGNAVQDTLGASSGDHFGWDVDIDDVTAFVGVPDDDDPTSGLQSTGSVVVYVWDGVSTWLVHQVLQPSVFEQGQQFGRGVAVDGDWAVVGASREDANSSVNSGALYIFGRDTATGVWSLAQRETPPSGPNAMYGEEVALWGNTLVAGAFQGASVTTNLFRAGRACVYEYDACFDVWNLTAELEAPDAAGYDAFGTSVAVHGNIVAVGSPGDDDNGSRTGAVYFFRRTGAGLWVPDGKLVPTAASTGDNFGTGVALGASPFGLRAVVGAPFDDDGALNSGAAYVLQRLGTSNWTQIALPTPFSTIIPLDPTTGMQFGAAVGYDGRTVAVGAPTDPDAARDAGSFYSFTNAGAQISKYLPPQADRSDRTGQSVAVSGLSIIGGAPNANLVPAPGFFSKPPVGAAYIYRLP